MRYTIIIILSLSFPALALESNVSNDTNHSSRSLQKKIQMEAGQNICNPHKELHMVPFN